MHILIYSSVGIVAAFGLLFLISPSARSFAATVWLITQVAPYQQEGVPQAPRLMVVGDSTAYGTGAARSRESVAGRLGSLYPELSISTNAVNGRLIAEALPVIAAIEDGAQPDILLLQIGANDIMRGRTPEQIRTDTTAVLVEAQQKASVVIFMSSGNVGAAPRFAQLGQPNTDLEQRTRVARAIFIDVSQNLGVSYIDLFEEPGDDVFLQQPNKYIAADGLHPSSDGYERWFRVLQPTIQVAIDELYQ